MADPSFLQSILIDFAIITASITGLVLFGILGFAFAFAVLYSGIPWQHMTFYALWVGLILSFCLTSVDLATPDKEIQRAVIITQGVVNGILVILLGFTVYNYSAENLQDRMSYIYFALPVTLIMSVVSLSAVTMNRLVA